MKELPDLKVKALRKGHDSTAGGVSELRKGADGNGIQISGGKVLVEWCWGLGSGDEMR